MADVKKIHETFNKIIGLMQELRGQFEELAGEPIKATLPAPVVQAQAAPVAAKPVQQPATPVQQPAAPVALDESSLDGFDALRKALESTRWPEAVNPHLICDPTSETDKVERGRGIIELMIEEDLKGLKFLDYGCGEGHCAYLAADYQTNMSIGYDIKRYDSWSKLATKPNFILTNDFDEVSQKGPYDIIILFDVIDHSVTEDPTGLLIKVRNILSDNGKIYARTHPFASRHGTHLYHDINKAYVHLVFTPSELKQLVPASKYEEGSIKVTRPLMTYDNFIKGAGLKIESKREITEKIEPFFKIPKIAERIMKNTGLDFFPEFQMSMQFIDYVLTKA